jgi:hypothetical protein
MAVRARSACGPHVVATDAHPFAYRTTNRIDSTWRWGAGYRSCRGRSNCRNSGSLQSARHGRPPPGSPPPNPVWMVGRSLPCPLPCTHKCGTPRRSWRKSFQQLLFLTQRSSNTTRSPDRVFPSACHHGASNASCPDPPPAPASCLIILLGTLGP